MRFVIADSFSRSLGKLDAQEQSQAKQAAFDLQMDPKHPSFQFHRLDRALDKGFWSARINQDLRLIVHQQKDALVLCYVDHHDAAYAWAERRRFQVSAIDGAAEILEVVERTQEVVKRVVIEQEVRAPLFAAHDDARLTDVGVPLDFVPAVRLIIHEDQILQLDGQIPAQALENLMELAWGHVVHRAQPAPQVPVFEHPQSRRRFHLVDDHDELRRVLEHPLEFWTVFLHPSQRQAVERTFEGPARVCGAAGTGKTVVALHRAVRLARQARGRVLLTTFSRTLAARQEQALDRLEPTGSEARDRIEVNHLHRLARRLWTEGGHSSFRPLGDAELLTWLDEARRQTGLIGFTTEFLRTEWDAVVAPWGLSHWDEYRGISRAGRGTALGARQRRDVWAVFEVVLGRMRRQGAFGWSRLCQELAGRLNAGTGRPFQHVVADEVQDFGPAELHLLRALCPPDNDDLLLCGDPGQRIFRAKFRWSSVGLDIRGRSTRLRLNYRTTEQIRKFADPLLAEAVEDDDTETAGRSSMSLLQGPPPEVIACTAVHQEIAAVATVLRKAVSDGVAPGQIAVLARTDTVLRERVDRALASAGVTGVPLHDDDKPSSAGISFGTIHRAKGLEFRVVVVMGCDEGLMPLTKAVRDSSDVADAERVIEQERQLLYVACTRAREQLVLSYSGRPSQFLAATGTPATRAQADCRARVAYAASERQTTGKNT